MPVVVFGTYDATRHPRVAVLAEGLRLNGREVIECNAPLGLDTADRVAILRQPWRLPLLVVRVARCWLRLIRQARKLPRPGLIVVGYMGHFDIHLARRLFRGVPIVLDHLISAADTARDREVGGRLKHRALRQLDNAALRAADFVVVDTEEHRIFLPTWCRSKSVVVAVGAPQSWFTSVCERAQVLERNESPLRVVFFGLYTPLQGAPVIGRALHDLTDVPIEVTMIGSGQERAAAEAAAGDSGQVHWLDWVSPMDLPTVVGRHDVCLGIFGTGDKALRVVPNKVYQGAAAGCAIITSDTPPQRRVLGDAAILVPPGDAYALARALRRLATDPDLTAKYQRAATDLARSRFSARNVVVPLEDRLRALERSMT